MESYDLQDTLAMVNVVRSAFGAPELHELPNARVGDSQSCLYYRALSDIGCTGVGSNSLTFKDDRQASLVAELWGCRVDGQVVKHPEQMRRVVNAFDHNKLRHYEASQYE